MSQICISDLDFLHTVAQVCNLEGGAIPRYSAGYITDRDSAYEADISTGYTVDRKKKSFSAKAEASTGAATAAAIGAAIAVDGTVFIFAATNARAT